MTATDEQQSVPMKTDGTRVRARRLRMGMSIVDLAGEAGVSRDTLSDLEAGNKRPHPDTVTKVLSALDRLEEEMGIDGPLPAGAHRIGDPADDLIEFTIEGTGGIRAVVKGPIRNMEELQAAAQKLIEGLRVDDPKVNGA